ncbi:asparagine synthase (glutamine-hydrolyzing) [Caproiciproducens galactitolivorans]|uniref:asparagine synthase (glutamine-hydrolyzing) n=1 Tax=Caproiciproducens galactitolivorans TaxID=642589 RepID=A0A4Z0Y1X1_9FIRM|nr:asparagine synthase (glutamine-hydrolyzing) [Caproiciproducens galactitolivorans]QEY34512.1 asparagine synthase (glutamine-hydrolyzing) [Caproiciproducens galactitolivorans]TGJ77704.1 asparagine synthetase 3 [Caproiciproducens galactitolivorans]
MCGIAGFCDYNDDLSEESYFWGSLAKRMGNRLKHRGPDDSGIHVSAHAAFAHTRLAVVDILGGKQPMTAVSDGFRYTIVYNGELYNSKELRDELTALGHTFETKSDTEILLKCYIQFGFTCAEKLNGIFAFAVDDERRQCCYLCRDRFGVKPLFYAIENDRLVFASEIKALFEYPGINPVIDRQGLCEIFGLGPARTAGVGVFRNVMEIKPGYCAVYDKFGLETVPYFELKSYEHPDSYEDSVKKVKYLVEDAVTRQLISDVPLCTFLSGGLDSSIITAIAARNYQALGKVLSTYSFDFTGNEKYFKPTAFQPGADRPWVEKMVETFQTNHHFLECNNVTLADKLYDSVIAKDLPGMADVDSSLLYFCSLVKKKHVVGLSGECADEIFGGYPWFHKEEAFEGHYFPWSPDLSLRSGLLLPEIADALHMDDYVNMRYEESIAAVPKLEGESALERRRREISYLNIRWFMSTLLDRKDRASMASGLEVRVPYADHRIVQYVFNTPWEYKNHNGVVKSLLRDAAKDWLPEDVLARRKSPYPKTHNPAYELLVKQRLAAVLSDEGEPIHQLIDKTAAAQLLGQKSDYGKPWFGQLMAGPQLMAYLLQINFWLKKYEIVIKL